MGVVQCVCDPNIPAWFVIRPEGDYGWPNALYRMAENVPDVRDDRMPIIVCRYCHRWAWADGKLQDPEGRLSA